MLDDRKQLGWPRLVLVVSSRLGQLTGGHCYQSLPWILSVYRSASPVPCKQSCRFTQHYHNALSTIYLPGLGVPETPCPSRALLLRISQSAWGAPMLKMSYVWKSVEFVLLRVDLQLFGVDAEMAFFQIGWTIVFIGLHRADNLWAGPGFTLAVASLHRCLPICCSSLSSLLVVHPLYGNLSYCKGSVIYPVSVVVTRPRVTTDGQKPRIRPCQLAITPGYWKWCR